MSRFHKLPGGYTVNEDHICVICEDKVIMDDGTVIYLKKKDAEKLSRLLCSHNDTGLLTGKPKKTASMLKTLPDTVK